VGFGTDSTSTLAPLSAAASSLCPQSVSLSVSNRVLALDLADDSSARAGAAASSANPSSAAAPVVVPLSVLQEQLTLLQRGQTELDSIHAQLADRIARERSFRHRPRRAPAMLASFGATPSSAASVTGAGNVGLTSNSHAGDPSSHRWLVVPLLPDDTVELASHPSPNHSKDTDQYSTLSAPQIPSHLPCSRCSSESASAFTLSSAAVSRVLAPTVAMSNAGAPSDWLHVSCPHSAAPSSSSSADGSLPRAQRPAPYILDPLQANLTNRMYVFSQHVSPLSLTLFFVCRVRILFSFSHIIFPHVASTLQHPAAGGASRIHRVRHWLLVPARPGHTLGARPCRCLAARALTPRALALSRRVPVRLERWFGRR
jgi:hypothetical protein